MSLRPPASINRGHIHGDFRVRVRNPSVISNEVYVLYISVWSIVLSSVMSNVDKLSLPAFLKVLTSNNVIPSKAMLAAGKMYPDRYYDYLGSD